MREDDLDVIIIGGGTAGLAALRDVRKRTERFVTIDDSGWSTTCARVGCMPSKTLIAAANAYHRRHALEVFGVRGSDALRIDVPAVLARVRALRDRFVTGVRKATANLGERAIEGRATLIGPDHVEVNGRRLRARHIIIATGSRPIVPEPWRELGDRLLTTDSLFEQQTLPPRMAVIGLGPVGSEMAQALSRLGIEVTGFDAREQIANVTDPVVNSELIDVLRGELTVHLGAPADVSLLDDGQVRVSNGRDEARVDAVLVALGRRPDVASLGLDVLGVELDERGLPTFDPTTMRVGDLPVFIAGDATAELPLLHEATDEGHIAALMATGATTGPFTRRVPLSIVFCDPQVAIVGKRFAHLDMNDTLVGEFRFDHQGRARVEQRNRGVVRIYAARVSGVILGAELCAPSAEHHAHLLALAIERRLTVHDLLRMPFYHPVLEEGVRSALRKLSSSLPPCAISDLAGCEPIGADALE